MSPRNPKFSPEREPDGDAKVVASVFIAYPARNQKIGMMHEKKDEDDKENPSKHFTKFYQPFFVVQEIHEWF